MKTLLFLFLALAGVRLAKADSVGDGSQASVLIVAGAGGVPEYASAFATWAGQWQKAAAAASARTQLFGTPGAAPKVRAALEEALAAEPREGVGELWLVLLGHGTWDGLTGKFNALDDDISIADLVAWLAPIKRPVIVVAAFSSSGAFLKPLSAPSRVIITATRAGSEENYARFGQYLSAAIGDLSADLDKDGEVSLLEAWLTAARGVADFYKGEGRLATEHTLLDDNGDGSGTPADWFEGLRPIKKPKSGGVTDGLRAGQIRLIRSAAEQALTPEQRARRDALELEVAQLREAKATMKEAEYYEKLEGLLLQIARLFEAAKR